MKKKSKEQLKVEKYFEENNVVHDGNCIYAVRRERNLNALLMSGILGVIFKTGVQPYYILFRDDEILFFKVGAFGGIKEFSSRLKVKDIKKIVLKKQDLGNMYLMSGDTMRTERTIWILI